MSSAAVMKAQKRKKQFAIEQFGGKCQICGYDKCRDVMHFHHTDPSQKLYNPSYIILRWSWDRVIEELKKCILVCANCHGELHYMNKDIEYGNQFISSFIEVECSNCNKKFQTKIKSQKYCGSNCQSLGTRKVRNHPTKSELNLLIENHIPWVEMGRRFGVSDNAVRRWARKYKLLT